MPHIKYALLNAIRMHGMADRERYTCLKLTSFYKIYHTNARNHRSEPKARNVHAILFARYYVQRELVAALHGEDYAEENDEEIQRKFQCMMRERWIASPREFENQYLRILQHIKPDKYYPHYVRLNRLMQTRTLTEQELPLFWDACVQNETWLEDQLRRDIRAIRAATLCKKHWGKCIIVATIGATVVSVELLNKFGYKLVNLILKMMM